MNDPTDMQPLRKWIHDLNNRVGVILATSELLQLEQLSPNAMKRTRSIEHNSLEVRDILRNVADRYLTESR
jgi:hypothetical protein